MTIAAYQGRCPYCGHDHDQILFHTSDREELDRLRAEVASLKEERDNAMNERDKLGYTVCRVIDAIENLIAGAEEYEGEDGFLHQSAPLDLWSELNSAMDDALPRASDYEALTKQLAAANSRVERMRAFVEKAAHTPDGLVYKTDEYLVGYIRMRAKEAQTLLEETGE